MSHIDSNTMGFTKSCCFTGHRSRLFPFSQTSRECEALKSELKNLIEAALNDGFDHFLVGGANGVDEWALYILSEMKEKKANFQITLALPFNGFAEYTGKADRIVSLSEKEDDKCYFKRNKYMVDNSQRIIAVYDEAYPIEGGTSQTIAYAEKRGIEIVRLRWKKLLDSIYNYTEEVSTSGLYIYSENESSPKEQGVFLINSPHK